VVLSELNEGVEDRAGEDARIDKLLGSPFRETGWIVDLQERNSKL